MICCVIIPCYKTDFVLLETYISDIIKYWSSEDVLEITLVIDGGLNEKHPEVQKFINLKEKFNNLRLILNHKHVGQQKSVLNGFDLSNSNILTSSSNQKESDFFRSSSQIKLHGKKFWPGIKISTENNEVILRNTNELDSLLSQRFVSYEGYVGIGDSTSVFLKLGYINRVNDSVVDNKLKKL